MCSCQRTFPDSLAAALSVRRLRLQANLVKVVGVTGVEPVTLRLSSACSNQLSYTPVISSERAGQFRLKVGGAEETRTPDL